MGYRYCWGSQRKRTPEGEKAVLCWTLFLGGFVTNGILWVVLAWYMLTEDKDARRCKSKK